MKKASRGILAAAAVSVAGIVAFSGCSKQTQPVMIAADPSNAEQMVLAEIYRQVVELGGRQVGLIGVPLPDDAAKFNMLQSHQANLTVLCTGSFVVSENPTETEALLAAKKDSEPGQASDTDLEVATYDAAVGTLPGSLMTLDPSPAQGCADYNHEGLPQNIIPVFETELFDRGVRQAMHKATRALSTDDLQELVAQTEQDGEPTRAVNEWLQEQTGMGAQLRRIVEEGEARDG